MLGAQENPPLMSPSRGVQCPSFRTQEGPLGCGGKQEYECQRYFKLEMAFGTTSNTADKSFRDASTTLRTTLDVANFMARPSIRARRCAGNVAMMSSSFFAIVEVLRKS